jgi:hypothetical protein
VEQIERLNSHKYSIHILSRKNKRGRGMKRRRDQFQEITVSVETYP